MRDSTPSFFMIFPFILIFSSRLILSTLFTFFSTSWLLIWVTIEINLLSFIPLIANSTYFQETERSIKYFLAQATGSAILVTVVLLTSHHTFLTPNFSLIILFSLRIIIKLGIAPAHFWLPSVILGLPWILVLVLSTWQKIAPLTIFSTLPINKTLLILLFLVSRISVIIGGWGGLNQTQLRRLIAYSSIGHLGWIISALLISSHLLIEYFLIYSFILFSIIIIAHSTSLNSSHFSTNRKNNFILAWLIIILISLAGLPPFLGFFPKWLIILSIVEKLFFMIILILILGTLINIFYYFSIFISIFYSSSFNSFWIPQNKSNNSFNIIIISSTIRFLIPSISFILYALTIFH